MLLKPRPFHGWPMLIGLSAAELVSWGILYYSFSVFIHPIEAELGWSRAQVTGAFSLALLVAGVAAIPVGHWLDARGARGLMTAGSVLGAMLLVAFSRVTTLPALYAVWMGLGVAMAMVLYEPAFAVVTTWFDRDRERALTILTVFGGLASTLVVPLAAWLLESRGWREAVLALAIILACTTIPLHGLVLRSRPSDVGAQPDGDPSSPELNAQIPAQPGRLGSVMLDGRFWALTAAFSLASLVTVAASVHLVPYLTQNGFPVATAGVILGLTGLMQLPGRLLFVSIRRRLAWEWMAVVIFLMQAVALGVLALATDGPGVGVFLCLFGLGNGMATLLRASTLAALYGASRYGQVSGVVSFFSSVGRAVGPVLASLAYATMGRYEWAFALLAMILASAAVLVLVPCRLPLPRAAPLLARPIA